jgi:hypothetical protein
MVSLAGGVVEFVPPFPLMRMSMSVFSYYGCPNSTMVGEAGVEAAPASSTGKSMMRLLPFMPLHNRRIRSKVRVDDHTRLLGVVDGWLLVHGQIADLLCNV